MAALELGDFLDGQDLPALVHAAVGADPVRELGLVAARALGLGRLLQVIMGAAAIPPGLGVTAFRIRHTTS
jgi:hypothetical protein